MKAKLNSILVLVIGGLLAFWFVRRLDWTEVWNHLRGASLWPLLLAVLLIMLTLVARTLRWQAFLAPIARVSLGHTFAATSIGFGSVFIFGRAGEIVRPLVLSARENVPPTATIATIVIERIFDMTTVAMMFSVNLLFFTIPSDSIDASTLATLHRVGVVMTTTVAVAIVSLVLFRLRSKAAIGLLEKALRWLPKRIREMVINLVTHLAEGLSVLLDLRELLLTALYTVIVWALVTAATWLVAYAFHIPLSFSAVLFVLGFGLVGSLVPTPGGSAGAFHAAAAAGLIVLGIDRNLAGSFSIVLHFVAFGPPFILALFFIIRDGIGIGRLREMMITKRQEVSG